jgi:type II secretory pathway component PulM
MADLQPDAHEETPGLDFRRDVRRRRMMLGVGLLLSVVVLCVAAILLMLQRLEARNASFQPPMTALERQRMLPQDPVLDAAPQIEGLRYGKSPAVSDDFPPLEVQQASHGPQGLDDDGLHADAAEGFKHASHVQ